MTAIKNVSGTAFVVAEFRAQENKEPSPLYTDAVVDLFLDHETRSAAGRVAASFPLAGDLVRIRTKYFDDMLDQQIASGVRQVVILGAGLDTRSVRKPAPGVAYFEIDDAATLKLKASCYREHRIPTTVNFIPGDYVADGVIDLLEASGFDFDLPTYVIWEGNTMYLPLSSNHHILRQIRKYLGRCRVSFDYLAEAVIARTTGDPGIARLVDSFASMGAPWLTGFRDIQSMASELQLNLIENFKTADLHRLYRPGRQVTSPIFDFYSVCTVGF